MVKSGSPRMCPLPKQTLQTQNMHVTPSKYTEHAREHLEQKIRIWHFQNTQNMRISISDIEYVQNTPRKTGTNSTNLSVHTGFWVSSHMFFPWNEFAAYRVIPVRHLHEAWVVFNVLCSTYSTCRKDFTCIYNCVLDVKRNCIYLSFISEIVPHTLNAQKRPNTLACVLYQGILCETNLGIHLSCLRHACHRWRYWARCSGWWGGPEPACDAKFHEFVCLRPFDGSCFVNAFETAEEPCKDIQRIQPLRTL